MLAGIFYNDNQFFRFYKDGTFLDCLIHVQEFDQSVHVEQIRQWFRRENIVAGVLKGSYTFKGKKVLFSTPGHFGDGRLIDYEGEYRQDYLVLDSLNHNTGRRLNRRFLRC